MIKHGVVRCVFALLVTGLLAACGPEVGSPAWCAATKEKPKADWSSNDITDYTRHCLFK